MKRKSTMDESATVTSFMEKKLPRGIASMLTGSLLKIQDIKLFPK